MGLLMAPVEARGREEACAGDGFRSVLSGVSCRARIARNKVGGHLIAAQSQPLRKTNNHHRPPQSAQSPSPTAKPIPKNDAPDSHQGTGEAEKNKEPRDNKFDRAMLKWTGFVGVFTAVLALVGGIQAWAFIESERAFLSMTSLSIDGGPPKAGASTIRIFIALKNSGRSAAFIEDAAINIHFGPLPKDLSYKTSTQIAIAPIAADSTSSGHSEFKLPGTINKTDAEEIGSGHLKMSIYGFVKYSDAFGFIGNKITGFCFYYTPLPTGGEPFDTCAEPNYTYAK